MAKRRSSYVSPRRVDEIPPWAVVYGSHDIVLGYCEDEETAKSTAEQMNKLAPEYNHRAKAMS